MAGQEIALLFNRIYNETNRSVLAYITAKCSSVSDIGDIFQETYLELYRLLLKRGDGYIQNPQALVIRLAKQKVYRHYTLTQRLHQLLPLEGKDEKRPLTIPEEAGPSLEDQICDQALVDQICRELAHRPQVVQKIFTLHYGLGMTLSETAQLLSVGESYVKNKLYRTIKELQGLYTEKDGDNP